MAVVTEKDLPQHLRASWLKAMSAYELKNYGYAIQLCQAILKELPGFLDGRKLARRAAAAKSSSSKKSLFGGLSGSSFSTMKAQGLLKKSPVQAMDAVEKILEADPHNAQANQILREAAMAADLPETATFALETIVDGNPKDTKTMHELAKHFLKTDQPDRAVEVYNKITEVTPTDLAAIKAGKDAAARASMKTGGWETAESYRDIIKDKDTAVALEQQNRVVRSAEMIDNLLAELHQKIDENPSHIDTAKRIAELYEQKDDTENAIQWYDYTSSLAGGTDGALVRKASLLRLRQIDDAIQAWEAYVEGNPEADDIEQSKQQLEELRGQRTEYELAEARTRVDRNPTDLVARFDLGKILLAAGMHQEAIPELQKAQQNPSVRLKAMNLLSQCYLAKGMGDLAAKTLEKAASELLSMDSTKKEVVYNLGLAYEQAGDMEKSLDCMKQIYEADYDYRDVAQRVEGAYQR